MRKPLATCLRLPLEARAQTTNAGAQTRRCCEDRSHQDEKRLRSYLATHAKVHIASLKNEFAKVHRLEIAKIIHDSVFIDNERETFECRIFPSRNVLSLTTTTLATFYALASGSLSTAANNACYYGSNKTIRVTDQILDNYVHSLSAEARLSEVNKETRIGGRTEAEDLQLLDSVLFNLHFIPSSVVMSVQNRHLHVSKILAQVEGMQKNAFSKELILNRTLLEVALEQLANAISYYKIVKDNGSRPVIFLHVLDDECDRGQCKDFQGVLSSLNANVNALYVQPMLHINQKDKEIFFVMMIEVKDGQKFLTSLPLTRDDNLGDWIQKNAGTGEDIKQLTRMDKPVLRNHLFALVEILLVVHGTTTSSELQSIQDKTSSMFMMCRFLFSDCLRKNLQCALSGESTSGSEDVFHPDGIDLRNIAAFVLRRL
ncbi:hypothetical protein L596_025433 [Steinernema carpocapsae]|uniref:Uncharacterized protein n=1 Tax=Steinernema carpocapsae TaxID=34508 RepID=A0A4U5M7R1_STECR|nr:hypothetical protein L596_025433 [Steinernema carpocapsae]